MLSIHMDDQFIVCNSRKRMDELKQALNLSALILQSAGYFLGIIIYWNKAQKKLYLSQGHYMMSLLNTINFFKSYHLLEHSPLLCHLLGSPTVFLRFMTSLFP